MSEAVKIVPNSLHNRGSAAKYGRYVAACSLAVSVGGCGAGHKFAKVIKCGKEYCPDCGEKGSDAHERRIFRWKGKVDQMATMGYFVVTVPEAVRSLFFDKQTVKAYEVAVVRYLRRVGIGRGLVRWHWLGDCSRCDGDGCQVCRNTGMGRKFNPHLNILVDRGYLSKMELEAFRQFCRKWLRNNVGYTGRNFVLHYSYTSKDEKKAHILRYVTRATLRHADLWGIRKLVYKFRTTSTFGKWERIIPEGYEIEAGICPCCIEQTGEVRKVKYGSKQTMKEVSFLGAQRVGAGYFLLRKLHKKPPKAPPDYSEDQFNDLLRLRNYFQAGKDCGWSDKRIFTELSSWMHVDKDFLSLHPCTSQEKLSDIPESLPPVLFS